MVAEEREREKEKRATPAKKGADDKRPPQPNALVRYFRETRGELRKVIWPTRQEGQRLTAIVLGVTAAMAVFLGILDWLFGAMVRALVDLVA
jgi:preprotein translocase subunit SecE